MQTAGRALARAGALALLLALAGCDGPPRLTPLTPSALILAFGDSLTHGTGTSAENSYPEVLARLIGRTVVRSGVPGEVTASGRQRLSAELRRHRPALVILCHGGNDILRRVPPATTEANLRAMIAEAQASGAEVVLVGVPGLGLFLTGSAPVYDRIAEELSLPYLEGTLAGVLRNDRLKSDTVHPNAAGYRKLAEDLAGLLRDAGAI